MKFLLDTNVISELRKANSNRADRNVVAWVDATKETDLYISVITVYEAELGALLIEHKDPPQGKILRNWVDNQIESVFSGRILPITTEIARRSAALNIPNPRPYMDGMIAATALVHNMILVTRNVSDFKGMGLQLINPWDTSGILRF